MTAPELPAEPPAEGFDFGKLQAEDAPPIPGVKPNADASKDKPRGWGRRKAETVPPGTGPHNRQRDAREKRENSTPKKPTIPNRKGQFVEPLENLYGTAGLMLAPFRPMTAQATMANARQCAEAVDEWAYRNESVRKIIHSLVSTSAVGAVIAAHLPILMALAMESGVFNKGSEPAEPRVVNPDGSEVPNAA